MNKPVLLSITGSICMLSSCMHHDDIYNTSVQTRINNCITTETYTVPVKKGYCTYVMYGDDTLAVATHPITIPVPKESVLTKSGEGKQLKIDYAILKSNETYSRYWQAVMFEDSGQGDYDYNDLIIHVRNKSDYIQGRDYSEMTIEIQPIALGSQKVIKLGCLMGPELTEVIFSDNVRKDLFNNEKGYINTEDDKAPIRYKLSSTEITKSKVDVANVAPTLAWFIEVEGKRYYAISAELDYNDYSMLNFEGIPYGLVTYSTFNYPKEKTSIFEAYPDFKEWVNGNKHSIGKEVKDLICKYCYHGSIGPNLRIWDYQDLK